VLKGFKNFLTRGELIIIVVQLVVALAFSALITSFTTDVMTPLIKSFTWHCPSGPELGWHLTVSSF